MALDVTGLYRYPPPNRTWLDQHREEILDPDLPIIDPHHHLWEQEDGSYLLDDILDDVGSGHNIRATVFAQCHYAYKDDGPEILRPVGETEKVVAIAEEARSRGTATDIAAGIIGFADLRLGSRVAEVVDAHLAAAPKRLRGVRHSVARDENFPNGIVLRPAPAGLLGSPCFREGLRVLAQLGLTFDAMLYHSQIRELAETARAVPELSIVLDHLGCPLGVGPYSGREGETFRIWRTDIEALARCPNVVVKLGGLGMIITGARFHERPFPPGSAELSETWRPYVETCIELFGADKCMFESNFPVDKGMFSYPVLWNAFKRLASGVSASEKAALFHATASRVYGLAL